MADATVDLVFRELHALFPSKLGESSTDHPKEGDTERDEDEEVAVRFRDFMKRGGCKESFTPLEDCMGEAQSSIVKCKQQIRMLKKCMVAHSDYYQPILTLQKTVEEHMFKEAFAFFLSEEKEQAARKQADG